MAYDDNRLAELAVAATQWNFRAILRSRSRRGPTSKLFPIRSVCPRAFGSFDEVVPETGESLAEPVALLDARDKVRLFSSELLSLQCSEGSFFQAIVEVEGRVVRVVVDDGSCGL